MRIVILHTRYQQAGGEDSVVADEKRLLLERGHHVTSLLFRNHELERLSPWRQALLTIWNSAGYRRIRRLIRRVQPDVVHIHNTFPLASPAAIHAAKVEGAPVVMTLHNYRLLCVNALLFRKGRVCESCLGQVPWWGIVYGCYRESRAASAVVAGMLTLHRAVGTWDLVDCYIALTEFARAKFLEAGFAPEKVVVKPNFVHPDPGRGQGTGGYVLFVGRLSREKGVKTLLRAWDQLGGKVPLKVVGDGPLAEEVRRQSARFPMLKWLGWRSPEEVYALMENALFLVFPSECYEGFPRVLVESFAKGLPVLATDLGSQGSIITNGRTGLLFRPGDPGDLAAKVEWLVSHPRELARMRQEARVEFEKKYTSERNYHMLMEIYEKAIENHRRGR